MNITPQPGMPVVYHPCSSDAFECGHPLAATITHVWSENMVNLQVLDMYGVTHPLSSVHLDVPNGLGRWCEFPTWFRMVMAPRKCARCEPIGPDPVAGASLSSGLIQSQISEASIRAVSLARPAGLCACGRSKALCDVIVNCDNKPKVG